MIQMTSDVKIHQSLIPLTQRGRCATTRTSAAIYQKSKSTTILDFIYFIFLYRCAEGDYSGIFGRVDGSGRLIVVNNYTRLDLVDMLDRAVFISGGGRIGCGNIIPQYGEPSFS